MAVTLSAMGCATVGPDYQRPPVEPSSRWLESEDSRLSTSLPIQQAWWEGFEDPVLNRLVETAYKENLTLRQAGLRVLEARAQLALAMGGLYPQSQQVSGDLQYFRASERSLQAGVIPLSYGQAQVQFSAAWEIDFWGKYRRAIESARAGWQGSLDDYDNALVSLTADVANAYFLIRTLEKRIDIARQNAKAQAESLEIAQARLRYGSTAQLDVEQAKTVLNNTLASIPLLEAQLTQTGNALSLLLGLPPSDLKGLLQGTSGTTVYPRQVAVGIPADLLRRRPDIRSAEHAAAAQSALIGVAKADLYPAFSLAGFFGFLSTDTGANRIIDIANWNSRTWQVGPAFQWTVLDYGRTKNKIRIQDARLEQLLTAYQNTVLKAQQEVESALAGFLKSQDRADYLAKSAEAAKKALELSSLQYREGIKDFTTVLVSQLALLNAQDSLVDTLGSTYINLVGVYRALGGGWEIREGQALVPEEIKQKMARRTDWGGLLDLSSEY
ncbi:MAG TPA: TolC family protein [Thermodesulfobacteriota bacterium]|nr:TolC family protein [Thermodesulfobacteriota bacterium]